MTFPRLLFLLATPALSLVALAQEAAEAPAAPAVEAAAQTAQAPPMAAPAATAAEAVEAGHSFSFMQIIDSGGVMMYPLAFLSMIGMVLVLLYFMTIRRNAVVSDRFMDIAESYISQGDFNGLVNFSRRHGQCIARITEKSVDFLTKNPGSSFGEVREIAESEGSRQAGLLSARITYLADIGSIAPMVGLLGTVLGMIKSFLHISQGNFVGVKQMQLASGVSEALITTAAGLFIGIPALVFYSIFRGRVQKYVSELEAATTHLMAMLHARIQQLARPARATPPPPAEDYGLPLPSPLSGERPDLHGI